jgi:hypothetical protein
MLFRTSAGLSSFFLFLEPFRRLLLRRLTLLFLNHGPVLSFLGFFLRPKYRGRAQRRAHFESLYFFITLDI